VKETADFAAHWPDWMASFSLIRVHWAYPASSASIARPPSRQSARWNRASPSSSSPLLARIVRLRLMPARL